MTQGENSFIFYHFWQSHEVELSRDAVESNTHRFRTSTAASFPQIYSLKDHVVARRVNLDAKTMWPNKSCWMAWFVQISTTFFPLPFDLFFLFYWLHFRCLSAWWTINPVAVTEKTNSKSARQFLGRCPTSSSPFRSVIMEIFSDDHRFWLSTTSRTRSESVTGNARQKAGAMKEWEELESVTIWIWIKYLAVVQSDS